MNKEQEELFGKYVAEFAVNNNLQLDDDDIAKAIELFSKSSDRWKSDMSASIEHIAKELGFNERDDHIVEMVRAVWAKIYFD